MYLIKISEHEDLGTAEVGGTSILGTLGNLICDSPGSPTGLQSRCQLKRYWNVQLRQDPLHS